MSHCTANAQKSRSTGVVAVTTRAPCDDYKLIRARYQMNIVSSSQLCRLVTTRSVGSPAEVATNFPFDHFMFESDQPGPRPQFLVLVSGNRVITCPLRRKGFISDWISWLQSSSKWYLFLRLFYSGCFLTVVRQKQQENKNFFSRHWLPLDSYVNKSAF